MTETQAETKQLFLFQTDEIEDSLMDAVRYLAHTLEGDMYSGAADLAVSNMIGIMAKLKVVP